jgi:hypothetical protein
MYIFYSCNIFKSSKRASRQSCSTTNKSRSDPWDVFVYILHADSYAVLRMSYETLCTILLRWREYFTILVNQSKQNIMLLDFGGTIDDVCLTIS